DPDPARTAILPPELTPTSQAPPPLGSTIPTMTPLGYPQEVPRSQPTEKRGSTIWIILGGTITLVVLGLMIVLGYLAWKAGNKPEPEFSRAGSNAPTNSNVPANANRDIESKPADNASLQWLDGVWEGEGYQSDTKTTW